MGAVKEVIFGALPPVRRTVPLLLRKPDSYVPGTHNPFSGRVLVAYKTGTQALSAALQECRRFAGSDRNVVIVPAYGCPDLISACLAVGLTPRLVDIDQGRWAYSKSALSGAMGRDVLAVVAVNFLGLGDDIDAIKAIADEAGVATVQDSAQSLPRYARWTADQIVLSFGRGKPLNLLGGGLLASSLLVGEREAKKPGRLSDMSYVIKALGFNCLTDRRIYWLTRRIATREIGRTRYMEPVYPIEDPEVLWRFGRAIEEYINKDSYNSSRYETIMTTWMHYGVVPLRGASPGELPSSNLRYPVLAKSSRHRDLLLNALSVAGFGATAMYQFPLHQIEGVPKIAATQGPFPNATELANRLLTLPTHGQVNDRDLLRMTDVVGRVSRSL